jgi:hypothetical protein
MSVVARYLGEEKFELHKARTALAASLVHDLGHGPFSHAFEDVGRSLKIKMANHETVSDLLIRNSEASDVLKSLGSGFASDVADVIKSSGPGSIYAAVVSSQFDADRLDYMQRDRLMTGTHHGAIDFDWLLSNLEVGKVPFGVDEESVGETETFVLGPKASYAAEAYLLGLFQLYPTVYFHKATRGAEKLFTELLIRLITLAGNSSVQDTGLSENHPLISFAKNPESLDTILALDDTVVWGAISMMAEARDVIIASFSNRLRDRKLFKCIDVRESLIRQLNEETEPAVIDKTCTAIADKIKEWSENQKNGFPQILIDQAVRQPYKHFQESKGPLNQIMMRTSSGGLVDVAKVSKVVEAIEPFKLFRVYVASGDNVAKDFIQKAIEGEVQHAKKQ